MNKNSKPTLRTDWSVPFDVSEHRTINDIMPNYVIVPDDFKEHYGNNWVALQSRWFFMGLKGCTFHPKHGINKDLAIRHLATIQGSFEPKHEHKQAAVAWLMSLWFDKVTEGDKILAGE